jgi:hypothetical protein
MVQTAIDTPNGKAEMDFATQQQPANLGLLYTPRTTEADNSEERLRKLQDRFTGLFKIIATKSLGPGH